MKLRFVEREINVPVDVMTPDILLIQKVKILQYWNSRDDWSGSGKWIDVPLGIEEKNYV